MKRIIIKLLLLFFIVVSVTGQTNISGYEYWFNDNYANKTTYAITPVSSFNLNTAIHTAGLSDGIHIFSVRFYDSNGVFSDPISHFFYKMPYTESGSPELVAYEYWFNDDYVNKIQQSANNQESYNLNNLISSASLEDGLHTFNVRFKDNYGMWSSTLSQFFYKMPYTESGSPELVAYEYWFNDDYVNKIQQSANNQESYNLNSLISVATLEDGMHTFHIRFKDNYGMWSSSLSNLFYKKEQKSVIDNRIVAYYYWVNDDFLSAQYVEPDEPIKDFNLLDNISMLSVPKGYHTIHFHFKDSLGLWSIATADSVEKLSYPIADFDYFTDMDCDSTVVAFIDNSIDGNVYLWNFGNGDTGNVKNPVYVYYQPGIYDVTLAISDTLVNKDSTITKTIEILGNTYYTLYDMACGSYTSPSDNYTWDSSGTYLDTIPNSNNCDSIITIELIIYPEYDYADTAYICYGSDFTFHDGTYISNVSSDLSYVSLLKTVNDCDSTINTNLFVNPVYIFEQNESICQEEIFLWRESVYFKEGIYYDSLTSQYGCDSVYILNLLVNNLPEVSLIGLDSFYCIYQEADMMSGMPAGGDFSGQGVSGNEFIPADAGIGFWHIVYTYTDSNDCTNTDTVFVEVNECFVDVAGKTEPDTNVKLYPNPNDGSFMLKLKEETNINIYNSFGVIVFSDSFVEGLHIFNFQELSNGVYFLKADSKQNMEIIKVVIKK